MNTIDEPISRHVNRIYDVRPNLNLSPPPDWTIDAVCATTDPDLFYSDGQGSDPRPGKRVCSGCPARIECAIWALEHDEEYGTWGGLTPPERRRMLRRGWRAGDELPDPIPYRRRTLCTHCRNEFVDIDNHVRRAHGRERGVA